MDQRRNCDSHVIQSLILNLLESIELDLPELPLSERNDVLMATLPSIARPVVWDHSPNPTPAGCDRKSGSNAYYPGRARQRDGREFGPETGRRRAVLVNSRCNARRWERDS